jgi:hypothetical protein
MKTVPMVIAQSGEYRLVHQIRDLRAWPNMSDLTLERRTTDAMNQEQWSRIDSWCLGPRTDLSVSRNHEDSVIMALQMILNPTFKTVESAK